MKAEKAEGIGLGEDTGRHHRHSRDLRIWVRRVPERQVALNSCSESQQWPWVWVSQADRAIALALWVLTRRVGGRAKNLQVTFPKKRRAELPWALSLPLSPNTHMWRHIHAGPVQALRAKHRDLSGRGWPGSPLNHRLAICSTCPANFPGEGEQCRKERGQEPKVSQLQQVPSQATGPRR